MVIESSGRTWPNIYLFKTHDAYFLLTISDIKDNFQFWVPVLAVIKACTKDIDIPPLLAIVDKTLLFQFIIPNK